MPDVSTYLVLPSLSGARALEEKLAAGLYEMSSSERLRGWATCCDHTHTTAGAEGVGRDHHPRRHGRHLIFFFFFIFIERLDRKIIFWGSDKQSASAM